LGRNLLFDTLKAIFEGHRALAGSGWWLVVGGWWLVGFFCLLGSNNLLGIKKSFHSLL
jgi:hypothetical protein